MQDTMLAAVWAPQGGLKLERRPIPHLQDDRDALVRVTRSAICTSDLHILHGAVPRAKPGVILGHEFVGEILEVGAQVKGLSPGDHVAANCETFCGECWFCRRGYVNNCVRGGWELGCRIDGCQAEVVRVPFADTGLYRIPSSLTDEDALFVGDILSSGYFGALLCDIRPGDTVVVLGAGPVGLCAAQCARLLGAGQVILLDILPQRLALAQREGLCSLALNPSEEDAVQAVRAATEGRGADAVIEAAGGEDTFRMAIELCRPNAVVALVAMYEKAQLLDLPNMYGKNLIFKTGGVDACHCPELLEFLRQGKLRTDFLITHRAPLDRIEEGYHIFGERRDGCLKWVTVME